MNDSETQNITASQAVWTWMHECGEIPTDSGFCEAVRFELFAWVLARSKGFDVLASQHRDNAEEIIKAMKDLE